MPAPKFEVRRRYFTERELYSAPLPADRLLYLELVEVDTEAGVARFACALSDPSLELWTASVAGWESRPEVREAVREAALGGLVEGGTLAVPLSRDPQVVQLEVRRPDLSTAVVYRITTQGMDERTFRYGTEQDPGAALSAGRYAVIEEGGRPVFDTSVDEGDFAVVQESDRPVFDSEEPASDFRLAYVSEQQRLTIYRSGE